MAKPKSSKNAGQRRKTKPYELSPIDLRFLKAVDIIIEKNRKEKLKLDSDSAISQAVYGLRTVIGKVRSAQRGISMPQLQSFAIYFNLDFNCFFRDTTTIEYDPQDAGSGKVVATSKGIANTGKGAIVTQVEGDHNGDIIGEIKGDVYKGSKIDQVIQKAEKIVNNHFDDSKQKEQCNEILETIQSEANSMENLILRKYEDIKKMADIYEAQILAEREKRTAAEQERDEAREEERKILKKYLKLVEK